MPIPCIFLVPSADSPGGVSALDPDCTQPATCVAIVHGITMNLCNQCACHICDTGDDDAKILRELPGGDSK